LVAVTNATDDLDVEVGDVGTVVDRTGAVCFKAMDKDPAKRYQTAAHLAADMDRYLNGFAILARRVGPVGRMIRFET